MERALSERERDVLVVMIERGLDTTSPELVTAADRQRWLAQVARTRVVGRCSCGTCPSIDLAISDSPTKTRGRGQTRTVLEGFAPGAIVLLFIDDDRLSYLELAPTQSDSRFSEFPLPGALQFDSSHRP